MFVQMVLRICADDNKSINKVLNKIRLWTSINYTVREIMR